MTPKSTVWQDDAAELDSYCRRGGTILLVRNFACNYLAQTRQALPRRSGSSAVAQPHGHHGHHGARMGSHTLCGHVCAYMSTCTVCTHKMNCTSPCRCAHSHTPMSELRSFSRRGFHENSDVFQRPSENVYLVVCCNHFPPAACPRSFAVVSASRHANVPIAAGGAGLRFRPAAL